MVPICYVIRVIAALTCAIRHRCHALEGKLASSKPNGCRKQCCTYWCCGGARLTSGSPDATLCCNANTCSCLCVTDCTAMAAKLPVVACAYSTVLRNPTCHAVPHLPGNSSCTITANRTATVLPASTLRRNHLAHTQVWRAHHCAKQLDGLHHPMGLANRPCTCRAKYV